MPTRKATHSASTRLIIQHLETTTAPQSYDDVAKATKVSYWTSRLLLKHLASQGLIQETKEGSSPLFSFPRSTSNTAVEGVAL
jgi:predicted ArsR family transcriptional regulator